MPRADFADRQAFEASRIPCLKSVMIRVLNHRPQIIAAARRDVYSYANSWSSLRKQRNAKQAFRCLRNAQTAVSVFYKHYVPTARSGIDR
jgi:hypothetical protein